MTRIVELEGHIQASYQLVCQYGAILSDASDPREKKRCRRNIDDGWGEIEGYLTEYLVLCRSLDRSVPEDMRELAARFPHLLAEEFQSAYTALQGMVSPENPALNRFMWVFDELVRFHEHLNEWKEVHNLVQDNLTALITLREDLEACLESPHEWKKAGGLRIWTACRTKLRELEFVMSSVKYVADPLTQDGTKLRGASWMIKIITLRDELDTALLEGDHGAIYQSTRELWDAYYDALFQADKHLRDMIAQLNDLSITIGRSVPHEFRAQ